MPEPTLWVLEEIYSTPGNAALAHTSQGDIKGFQLRVRLTAGKGYSIGHRTHRSYAISGIRGRRRCCGNLLQDLVGVNFD